MRQPFRQQHSTLTHDNERTPTEITESINTRKEKTRMKEDKQISQRHSKMAESRLREIKSRIKQEAAQHGGQSLPPVDMESLVAFSLALAGLLGVCCGHGMLWDPPSRSSLWRFGYDTPINYDDNQLYCGGFNGQMSGKFKCGVCGDPFDAPQPRDNEDGGLYGLGIITRTYKPGESIPVAVNLDTEHKGYFVFHVCNLDDGKETEECFRTLLYEDGSRKYYVHGSRFHNVSLQLPEDIRCDHCVLRWHYRTGNSWGICDDGTEALGCGPQETFRNCADIAIKDGSRRSNR